MGGSVARVDRGLSGPRPRPTGVLPATISALGKECCGGGVFVETVATVDELSPDAG
jgi:hypothetical protein